MTIKISSIAKYIPIIFLGIILSACKSDLYTNLSEQEANEMVSVLIFGGIEADRIKQPDGTYSLRVQEDSMANATSVLKSSGYPRQSYNSMGDIFSGNGFVMSPTEEKARLVYALNEELAQTISSIDGILSARVHVVLPERDLMRRSDSLSSASVFVRYRDQLHNMSALVPQIKMLVAKSVEGLTYENVSVVKLAVPQQLPATQQPIQEAVPVQANSGGAGWLINGGIMLAILAYVGWAVFAFSRTSSPPARVLPPRKHFNLPHRIVTFGTR